MFKRSLSCTHPVDTIILCIKFSMSLNVSLLFSQSSRHYDKTTYTHRIIFLNHLSWILKPRRFHWKQGVWFEEQSQPRWGSSHKFWWNYHIPHVCTHYYYLVRDEIVENQPILFQKPKPRKKSEKWENDRPPHSSNQTHRKLMHGDVMQTTQTANNIVARSFKGVLITMAAYDFNSMCPFCSLRFSWASLYLSEWSSSVSNFISKCSFYTSALHSEKLLLLSLFAWTKFSFFPKKKKEENSA
jgi:hypothetical protein